MNKPTKNPLGKPTEYPGSYSPGLLFAVPRAEARAMLRIGPTLPFHGEDLWNAWELSWLDAHGRPVVAVAELRIPADSPNIIESKSLKLYLGSLAGARFPGTAAVRERIASDLGACARCEVSIEMHGVFDAAHYAIAQLPGICIDDTTAVFEPGPVRVNELSADSQAVVSEQLHSHLLRSNCPVTGQPDTGSILISYTGPQINRASLLQYLVSFREHQAFHEACVEKIFVDLKQQCGPSALTVYGRYNRRGGIDINPFRSDFEQQPSNTRLWRQ